MTALALGPSLSASALAQTRPDRLQQWTTDDGLPAHSVNAVLEGPTGHLWLATTGGLVRFDGRQFAVMSAADGITTNRFLALFVDRRGRLLASSADGRVYASETTRFVELARGFVVRAFGEDADGSLWGGNDAGIARLEGNGEWGSRRPGTIESIAPTHFTIAGTVLRASDVSIVAQPSSGRAFSRRLDGATMTVGADGSTPWRIPLNPPVELRLVDRDGQLWVSGSGSVKAFVPGRLVPVVDLSLPAATAVTSAAEDSEGSIWIGTNTAGLFRIVRPVARTYGRAEGAHDDQARHLAEGVDGRLSVQDATGATHRFVPDEDRLAPDAVPGFLFADGRGTEWSLDGNELMARIDGVLRRYPLPGPRARQLRVRLGLSPIDRDVAWVGGLTWVARFAPYERPDTPFTEVHNGLSDVVAIHRSRSGATLILCGAGLLQPQAGRLVTLVERTVLPEAPLRALYEDSERTLWIGGYGGGLTRVRDGNVRNLTTRDGLLEDVISTIVADADGRLWMAGNRGIQWVAISAITDLVLGRSTRVYPVLLGRPDGLRNPETSGSPALKARDGRLWFPTFGGAVVVDPKVAASSGVAAPRVWIERVEANGMPLEPGAVRVAPGERRLSFEYAAIALASPDLVRYQYRLDGVDEQWVDAGPARTATYTSVPPGPHVFRVRATRGGPWSLTDATVAVVVEPFLWETVGFRAGAVLVAVGLIAGLARLRGVGLRRRAELLQDAVDSRTSELRAKQQLVAAQAEQLRDIDRARSRFFAGVSHEFRTPLTLIEGPLDDVIGGAHGPLPAAARDLLRLSAVNARRLLRLVGQLLDLAKAESGRLTLQAREIDLRTFTLSACESFRVSAGRAGLEFRIVVPQDPVWAWIDPDHVEKVLVNLIGNSIKYTPLGGSIAIELRPSPPQADGAGHVDLVVSDSGVGISPADLPHIFERFYRGTAASARSAGTGIGLSLVRELVDLHRGTVTVDSSPGGGATFTVTLPLGRAHLREADVGQAPSVTPTALPALDDLLPLVEPAAPPEPSAAPLMTLLVADDSADVREYLRRSLSGRFEVIEAADGVTALALIRSQLPDIVVSDVMMPEMDGVELCRAVKADLETEFVPVILLTARASSDSRVEGLEVGADDYVVKPFNMRELVARIDNLVASRKRLQARTHAQVVPTPELPAAATEDEQFVARLQAAIATRLGEEGVTAETLAGDLAMSRATLYRRVEQTLGQGPMDLLWTTRLEHAATRLIRGEESVADIAYGLGFSSLSHFSRRFRERYGKSPSAWRAGASNPSEA